MNRINEFVNSFVPVSLPEKRKSALNEELICHILDKADYYKELGFDKDTGIDKAIEDFGTDEHLKKYILGEFEELYHERTVFGILAGIFILVMNWMCVPLDIWVASADYNRDPDPAGAFVSFCMIFAVLGLIVFARIKKYRKMLLCIGISNILVVGIFLWCFYPQMASYSMVYNIIYLVDRFTPLLLGKSAIADGVLYVFSFIAIPVVLAIYPIVASILLKTGRIGTVKNPRKKCIVTGAVCIAVCIITCLLQTTGWRYYDDYPVWFNPYILTVAEETHEIYSKINIGDSKESAVLLLEGEGFCSFNAYRSKLDKLTKKQFDADADDLTFADGYTIYFHPEKYIDGQGLVGIREKDGIVTGVAVGNIGKYMYDTENHTFGYYNTYTWEDWDDMKEVREFFDSLTLGEKEEIVMLVLDAAGGEIYAERKYTENESLKTYYRIYFYGLMHPDKKTEHEQNDGCFIELSFSDGALENGVFYTETDEGGERNIYKDEILP